MKTHAAKYEHERLRPGRAPSPHRLTRKVHLLPPIAEPVKINPAEVVRCALEAISRDGACSVDLVAGRAFVRKSYEVPLGIAVGTYNERATASRIADDLAAAMAETRV